MAEKEKNALTVTAATESTGSPKMADRPFSARKNSVRVALILIFMAGFFIKPANAQMYFAAAPDLPLPPGFSEQENAGVNYEIPGLRILELVASGTKNQDITIFYQETLPMLGWQKIAPHAYVREGDHLTINLTNSGPNQTLTIRIEPDQR